MKFGAISLYVNDMETMVNFYKYVMGLNINWDGSGFTAVEMEGQIHHFILCKREIFENSIPEVSNWNKGINGNMEICFDVPKYSDVDIEFERVIKAGAKPVYKPTTESFGMRVCYVADPEGNLIEICSGNDDTNY
ncbi:VOC family protein [Oceanirhabdus seepicola]|uniref:VOC family protein n=1 Tax=Oceanirhabdus seepicola TaxID=2828781 RepID=A0A9J6P4W8_9CLOT|nr:VOC family protein [Oceanirhabdus seepicola]MCM1991826.1 VOC family protein [Oceanirhabdus seepicola]